MNTPEASTPSDSLYPHILAPGDSGYDFKSINIAGPGPNAPKPKPQQQKVHPVIDHSPAIPVPGNAPEMPQSNPQQLVEDPNVFGQLVGVAVTIGGASVGGALAVVEFAKNQPQAGTVAVVGGAIIAATGNAVYHHYHKDEEYKS